MTTTSPSVSIVVVSDYASGMEAGWNDMRGTVAALARQDFSEPVEFLIAENAELAARMPEDIKAALPALRVIAAPLHSEAELEEAAVEAACGEIVAVLHADCIPKLDWLRHLVGAVRAHPDAAMVSGKTTYGGDTLLRRAMAASSRSYLDTGGDGPTRHISHNNAGYWRSSYLALPPVPKIAPFGSVLKAEAILRAGGLLIFEPRAHVVHAHHGWKGEWHTRLGLGYGLVRTRRVDRTIPHAWMANIGYLSIPVFIAARILHSWWYCLRRGRDYGVAWYEMPAAFVFAAIACTMEAPGMLNALRDRPPPEALFR